MYIAPINETITLFKNREKGKEKKVISNNFLKVKEKLVQKKEYKKQFIKEFNRNFDKDFKLYCSQEIIRLHLFGYGDENELFRDAIGDFIAIAENSNKCIITDGDEVLKSQHAGYSNDEIYVSLIVIDKC